MTVLSVQADSFFPATATTKQQDQQGRGRPDKLTEALRPGLERGAHRDGRSRGVLRSRSRGAPTTHARTSNQPRLVYEEQGSTRSVLLIAVVNATAEGDVLSQGMWSATPMRKPILTTTLARIMATTATRNLALVLAGDRTSLLFGYPRPAMSEILASTIGLVTAYAPLRASAVPAVG